MGENRTIVLEKYLKSKNMINLYVSNILEIAEKNGVQSISDNLYALRQRLEDDQFRLVVVGMFSRGKSTFVDALLGKRLLPTSKKPTTAVISKITYNEIPEYYLHYKDDVTKKLQEDEFFNLTASNVESDTSVESKIERIDFAEVKYPLSFCKNGVELVDTPGTNDLNQARVEITYQYLDKADAVIMLLAADQALSVGEVEFLKERILKNQISDIFFIINRKDTLSGPDEELRVIEFVKQNLLSIVGSKCNNKLRIHLVSSYQALLFRRQINGDTLSISQQLKVPDDFSITGFSEFESDLSSFLAIEKGDIKLKRFIYLLSIQRDQLVELLNSKMEIVEHSTDNLDDKIKSLKQSISETRCLVHSVVKEIELEFNQSRILVLDKCRHFMAEETSNLKKAILAYEGEYTGADINCYVKELLQSIQKHIMETVGEYQRNIVKEGSEKAQKKIDNYFIMLNKSYSEAFNLSSTIKLVNFDVSKEFMTDRVKSFEEVVSSSLYKVLKNYYSNDEHNIFVRTLAGITSIFASISVDDEIAKIVLEQVYPLWSRNLQDNINSDYDAYVSNVIRHVEKIADVQLDELGSQLDSIVSIKKNQEKEKKRILENLKIDISTLKRISDELITLER